MKTHWKTSVCSRPLKGILSVSRRLLNVFLSQRSSERSSVCKRHVKCILFFEGSVRVFCGRSVTDLLFINPCYRSSVDRTSVRSPKSEEDLLKSVKDLQNPYKGYITKYPLDLEILFNYCCSKQNCKRSAVYRRYINSLLCLYKACIRSSVCRVPVRYLLSMNHTIKIICLQKTCKRSSEFRSPIYNILPCKRSSAETK